MQNRREWTGRPKGWEGGEERPSERVEGEGECGDGDGEDVGDGKHGETGGGGRRASSAGLLCCKYLLVVCLLGETT